MITDARRLPPNSIINCDICIIGAGAAGIALASELLHSGKDVVLLEGGGTRLERGMQDLYKGEVVDPDRHGRLELYRQRRFGGTTAVWGGRCAPFDEIDFECRPYLPHSGWPIHKTDLDPYYVRAHEYCDLGTYAYRVSEALPNQPEEMIPGLESSDVHKRQRENRSCPELFSFFTGRTTGHPASKGLSNAQNVFRTRSPSLESTP